MFVKTIKQRKIMNSFFRFSVILFLLLFPVALFAQLIDVSGTVVDEVGEPLTGVSIQVKLSSTGTVTDIDGNFHLLASPNSVLMFSFIGFVAQEVPVSPEPMRIVLREDQIL